MSYTHLTINERTKIETLFQLGFSARAIALHIRRHHSTVSRELNRMTSLSSTYEATDAQEDYQHKRMNSKPKGKFTPIRAHHLTQALAATWSPEQMEGRLKLEQPQHAVSFKTIYRWIYEGKLVEGNTIFLRHKGKRRKPRETRGRFNLGRSIRQRPRDVKQRETFGHWELDTVVSSRGKSKGCLATFIERKTRYYYAVKMPDRSASSMEHAVATVLEELTLPMLSATVDRGKEFACHENLLEEHGLTVYFADPYSSWQRGSNENANGLLREFYPKRYDLNTVDQAELEFALDLINRRPRKCLNWKTSHEAIMEELSHLA